MASGGDSLFTLDVVRDFMIERGGKVKNNELVTHFKSFLNDKVFKVENRAKFKQFVNTLSTVKLDPSGEKVLVLKKKYRDGDPMSSLAASTTISNSPKPKLPAPKTKLKDSFVPRAPSPTDEDPNNDEPPGEEKDADAPSLFSESKMSLMDEIMGGLASEAKSDPEPVSETPRKPSPVVTQEETPEIEQSSNISEEIPHSDTNTDPPVKFSIEEPQVEEPKRKTPSPVFEELKRKTPSPVIEEPIRKSPSPVFEDALDYVESATVEAAKPEEMEPEVPVAVQSEVDGPAQKDLSPVPEDAMQTPEKPFAKDEDKEPLQKAPMSVMERAKHLNKISSQTDLNASYVAAPKKHKAGSEGRDDDDHHPPELISLSPEEREWMLISASSDYQAMAKLIRNNPTLAKRKDFTSGFTALHWAAKHGNADVVKLLCGTTQTLVDARSNGGYTPLHLAAMQGRDDIIELLIQIYGANANLRDHSGRKAKQYLKNSASSRTQQLLAPRRLSQHMAPKTVNAGVQMTNFKRIPSYSAKIRTTGGFGIHAGSAMRSSWVGGGGSDRSRSATPSPSPSPSASPSQRRRGSRSNSASNLSKDDTSAMPPPEMIPPPRRNKGRSGSRTKENMHGDGIPDMARSDSDPGLHHRMSAAQPPAPTQYSSFV